MLTRKNHLVFAILLVVLSVIPTTVSVQAQDGGVPPVLHQEAPMVLLCDQMDAEALEYAHEHGLCLTADASRGEITPDYTEVTGDCGTSYMDVINLGSGFASFHAGVNSSQGAMASVNWYVDWTNWANYWTGNYNGTQYGLSGTWEYWSPTTETRPGWVTATLGGTVTLWWGGLCGILVPTDGETIT